MVNRDAPIPLGHDAAGKAGDVRAPWLLPVLVAITVVVCGWLLYLTSYKNFFYDEWDFIVKGRPWTLDVFFLPHNEHWSTIPILIWKLLFIIVGIRSHIPFEAALLFAHTAAVLLLFAFIRRHSGDLPAFGGATTLLVLGGGGVNMVWAFQIGFVGAVAFGLLALLLISGAHLSWARMALGSVFLLCSLMSSGVGLAFLAAAVVWFAFDSQRRPFWPVLLLPVTAFGAWFLIYGAGLAGTPGAPCSTCAPTGFRADIHKGGIGTAYLYNLGLFVWTGLQASVGAIFAAPGAATLLLPLVGFVIALHLFLQRRIKAWQIAMLVGAVAWFTLVGLGRSQRGPSGATDSHYLYIGAAFLLPLLADAAGRIPWRGLWTPLLATIFALLLIANGTQLREVALGQTDLMQTENAELQTAQVFRAAPDLQLDQSLDDTIMPQLKAGDLFAASDELGSPVPNATISTIANLQPQAVDQEMVNLFAQAFKVGPDASRSAEGIPCQTVDSSAGSNIDFQLHSSQSLMLRTTKDGDAFFFLGFLGQFPSLPLQRMSLAAMTPEWVHIPDTGKGVGWRLRVQTLSVGPVIVCSTASPTVSRPTNFNSNAASFTFGPGWSSVRDPAASNGSAARAAAGTPGPQGAFGTGFIPTPGSYDIWYRVRVASGSSTSGEMILGLVDLTANHYAATSTFRPNQATTSYTWLLVASGVELNQGDVVRFQTNIARRLTTDWYVDEALLVPAGSAAP